MSTALLELRDLRAAFFTDAGPVYAVDGVSWSLPRGRTLALVGESGCGKSATALSILRLLPEPKGRIVSGSILFHDQGRPIDLALLSDRDMRRIRGNRIAMIFQEPASSLNPVFTVGDQIVEAIELHQPLRRRRARDAAVEMLARVGIPAPAERMRAYPHELSGGMCQRVMIAMALACRPDVLIADEPTTALDVTIQAQILDLLRRLQAETGMSILIITHDLGVVAQIADDVCVMYAGRIVERATVQGLFSAPLHPYSQGLMRCMPRLGTERDRLESIPGQVPDLLHPPSGCRFHPRCALSAQRASANGRVTIAVEAATGPRILRRCVEIFEGEPSGPPTVREAAPGHFVECWEA